MENKNVVDFDRSGYIKFIVRSVWSQIAKNKDGSPDEKEFAVIAIKNRRNNKSMIHPLTDFIFYKWKYSAFNTMKSHAYNLVKFLNFVIENKTYYNLSSLSELNLEHGSDFLNELTYNQVPRSTVKKIERTITEFYIYLAKRNFITIEMDTFEKKTKPYNKYETYYVSPFHDVNYLGDKKNNILHTIPDEYILYFLEMAFQTKSVIALGVYMQFFGGLRVGEIVNLRRMDISTLGSYGENGLVLNIESRTLRTDLSNTSGSNYVKKPRYQLVLGYKKWAKVFYKTHVEKYPATSGSDPLFINKHGYALTGQSYRYYFNKLKEEFLSYLRNSKNAEDKMASLTLASFKWSTHLGRGVFSNLLAEEAKNLYEVSFPRGDSSFESVMPYFANTTRMKEKLENRLDTLYGISRPDLINHKSSGN